MTLSAEQLFASLANDTRMRCLMLLRRHAELCVCELTHALGISQPHVSRHLALLRENGLVADRRSGLWVYYRLNPQMSEWISNILNQTYQGLASQSPYKDDAQALDEMPNRPDSPRCA